MCSPAPGRGSAATAAGRHCRRGLGRLQEAQPDLFGPAVRAGAMLPERAAGSPRGLIPDRITRPCDSPLIAATLMRAKKNGRLSPPVWVTATSDVDYFFLAGDLTEIATASV